MLVEEQRTRLVRRARAAASRAFLTSPGGTVYGAAVLTASGNIHQSGQYSSFNHVTNIHAEQAAIVLATMADDSDVLALAVASTAVDLVTRPCGVCRQVLAEHAVRIGRDFEVLMACRLDDTYETARVSDLLPMHWSPGQNAGVSRGQDVRVGPLRSPAVSNAGLLQAGDHVILVDGSLALVWEGDFDLDHALVKLKYTPTENGLRKVEHSFTEPLRYLRELQDLGWCRQAKCGVRAAVIESTDISSVIRAPRLDGEIDKPPGPLLGILRDAGVDTTAMRVTGSRALGLQRENSDWDLVVPIMPSLLPSVRNKLATAMEQGMLSVPPHSGTWKLLDRIFPGGREAALRSRRFTDTVLSGEASVAMMFVSPETQPVCIGSDWLAAGRATLHGRVVRAQNAVYKRGEYELLDDEGLVRVTCYHKTANLLRAGDVISVCGTLVRRGEERRLIQVLPQPDRILWWKAVTDITAEEYRS